MAEQQDDRQLAAGDGEARVTGARRHAGGQHRSGGRTAHPHADLDQPPGDRAQAAQPHPRDVGVGAGARPRRSQCGRRGYRRRAAGDAGCQGVFSGHAVRGGRGGSRDHRSVAGVDGGEGLPSAPGAHGLPVRGGAGRDVERDRPGGPGMAHPGVEDEGRRRAPRSALRRCCGRAGVCPAATRSTRLGVPVAVEGPAKRSPT